MLIERQQCRYIMQRRHSERYHHIVLPLDDLNAVILSFFGVYHWWSTIESSFKRKGESTGNLPLKSSAIAPPYPQHRALEKRKENIVRSRHQ